jgi:hypothetical protein
MSIIQEISLIFITPKNDTVIYTALISWIIGLFGVYLGYRLKEQNENDQEEFSALLITKELLDETPLNDKNINDFYNKLRFDLRIRRLSTYDAMRKALL